MATIGDVRKVVQNVKDSKTYSLATEAWKIGFQYRMQAFDIALMEDLKISLKEVLELADDIQLKQKGKLAYSRLIVFLQRRW